MKKLVLVICMMLSFTAVSLAQKNEIGIKVGYSTIDPSDYESGAMVGLNYTYYFSNNFGLGATVNGFAYKVKGLEDNLINTFDGIHIASKYYFTDKFLLNVKVGAGIYTSSYPSFTILSEGYYIDFPKMDASGFGYNINAGLRYDLTKHFGLGLDLDYIASSNLKFEAEGTTIAEEKQSSVNLSLSATFRF